MTELEDITAYMTVMICTTYNLPDVVITCHSNSQMLHLWPNTNYPCEIRNIFYLWLFDERLFAL